MPLLSDLVRRACEVHRLAVFSLKGPGEAPDTEGQVVPPLSTVGSRLDVANVERYGCAQQAFRLGSYEAEELGR